LFIANFADECLANLVNSWCSL